MINIEINIKIDNDKFNQEVCKIHNNKYINFIKVYNDKDIALIDLFESFIDNSFEEILREEPEEFKQFLFFINKVIHKHSDMNDILIEKDNNDFWFQVEDILEEKLHIIFSDKLRIKYDIIKLNKKYDIKHNKLNYNKGDKL